MTKMRVRFAPSPTGALHIGGVRTALYNYLLAKRYGGTFILRIEDTDQTRYVEGAEDYIKSALEWCGLIPDEGPGYGGDFGPYRQSERKTLYAKYAQELIDTGNAYYAFDTPEDLDALRKSHEAEKKTFTYNVYTREKLNNSFSLSKDEVKERIAKGEKYVIRFLTPKDEIIYLNDVIRGEIRIDTNTLDDKILFKSDGMPTYHLANIVDDHLMEITHVIRGEEWLPSLPLHSLLYRAFGWDAPKFAHLPLILKPTGKGKLSKRDGAKLGIPVFPLSWEGDSEDESFIGFKEYGFESAAVINFLAFLGWNPGTEQEIFSLDELVSAFSIERINKSGARFDFDKAKWYNQQYVIQKTNAEIAKNLLPYIEANGYQVDMSFLEIFSGLMKERVHFISEMVEMGYYFFEPVKEYDHKTIKKKWKPERRPQFIALKERLNNLEDYSAVAIEQEVKSFMSDNGFGFGDVLPILRVGLSGTMKGPAVFDMMSLIGKKEVSERLKLAYEFFDEIKEGKHVG